MPFFSKKAESYLGIDIGGQTIKLVELFNDNGRARLRTYGIAERKVLPEKKEEESIEEIVGMIKVLCKKAKTDSPYVVTSLPSFNVFSSIISLPESARKDLNSAVIWEAKKLIPFPLEEMKLDWHELSIRDNTPVDIKKINSENSDSDLNISKKEEKFIKVLLTAAPKNLGLRYLEIFKRSGLILRALETETVAMVRSLVGGDKGLTLLIDMGAKNTNLSLIDQGIPVLNRGIDIGGVAITRVLERFLGVSYKIADQFKVDLANHLIANQLKKEMPRDLELVLSPITNEIKYIFSLIATSGSEIFLTKNVRKVDRIILSGGSAWFPYLLDHLVEIFDVPVYIGDPWARVSYPEELKYTIDEIGPKFSIAIGLALREIYH